LGGLPGDGDPFALVAAVFEQIGDRDRVVPALTSLLPLSSTRS
jgi:hypothetical protein